MPSLMPRLKLRLKLRPTPTPMPSWMISSDQAHHQRLVSLTLLGLTPTLTP
jgi:hypothetical protein